MPNAPEIKVKLTAEDAGVSAAIKELTGQLKNLKKQQDETATSSISLKNAFAGIAAGAAAIGLARIGKEAFDSAVNIGKMSDKTGITTETLSVFHHVAEEAGVSTEGVDKALGKAARTITQFESGSKAAAAAFKTLGITQKDFASLKPDEKLALVTEKLGHMAKGFEKNSAAAAIFGARAGTDIIPVANAIAGEGFDKITESVSKLGLLLHQTDTDAFRQAQASIKELEAAGKGMTTQFEAGMLPAITDVADGLLNAFGDDGSGHSFKDLGEEAGSIIKGIAFGILSIGVSAGTAAAEVEEFFSFAFNHTKAFAQTTFAAIGGYIRGGIGGAVIDASAQMATSGDKATQEFLARIAAIEKLSEASQQKIYDSLYVPKKKPLLRPDDPKDAPRPSDDSIGKAQLSLLKQQLDQELTLYREYEKVRLAVDQQAFEKGQLSLTDYFAARRAEIVADHQKEIGILESQRTLEKKAPADTEAEGITKKAKIQALDAKIAEAREAQVLKLATLDTEEFKKREENQQKILEFHKLIDQAQGKGIDVAKQEIAIETQKLAVILRQSGETEAQVQAELARYRSLKTGQATFDQDEKDGAAALKILDDQKAAIQDKVATGKLFQVQADQQILDLYRDQLPLLQQLADKLKANASTKEEVAKAADFQKSIDKAKLATNTVGQQVAQLKGTLEGSLTSGFANLFTTLISGTKSVGDAFKSFAAGVLNSLAQIAAQMLATMLVKKLLGTSSSGGGGLLGLFGFAEGGLVPGRAEGGLIKGPGGPKSDSIPARVSPGEYIVKADAVSAFGVGNLEAINRGLKIPSIARIAFPQFGEGGLVGSMGGAGGAGGGDSNINLGISLDEGLILKHLSSKAARNIILQHLSSNPKAAGKALSRSG